MSNKGIWQKLIIHQDLLLGRGRRSDAGSLAPEAVLLTDFTSQRLLGHGVDTFGCLPRFYFSLFLSDKFLGLYENRQFMNFMGSAAYFHATGQEPGWQEPVCMNHSVVWDLREPQGGKSLPCCRVLEQTFSLPVTNGMVCGCGVWMYCSHFTTMRELI